jgi:L-alanine-DL-glutamate epimerase-like enolase superfamily enzyme
VNASNYAACLDELRVAALEDPGADHVLRQLAQLPSHITAAPLCSDEEDGDVHPLWASFKGQEIAESRDRRGTLL